MVANPKISLASMDVELILRRKSIEVSPPLQPESPLGLPTVCCFGNPGRLNFCRRHRSTIQQGEGSEN